MGSTVTPSQAATPFSHLQDHLSIPLAARIVILTDEEKVLDADDRINVEFDVNKSIMQKRD